MLLLYEPMWAAGAHSSEQPPAFGRGLCREHAHD